MDARPMGVFDSGIGGLSVLRALVRQLPGEDMLYFADTANCPYGARPRAEIERLSHAVAKFLVTHDAKLVVVACNTASAAALPALRARFDIPFVGMVPAVKPAAARSVTRKIGVLATAGTVQGALYSEVVERFANGVEVYTQVGHGLVELVEAGEVSGERVEAVMDGYLQPMLSAGVDTLVLGCTHYPFLMPAIEHVSAGQLVVVEPSAAIAAQAGRVLAEYGRLNSASQGRQVYYTSGDPEQFSASLTRLCGVTGEVQWVRWDGRQWQVSGITSGC